MHETIILLGSTMTSIFTQERVAETYRSLISLSIEGFRYLALINGGAAVALLTFSGGNVSNVTNLHVSLIWFLFGLMFCGLAMLFAYLTQLCLLDELQKSGRLKIMHGWLLKITIVGYAFSLLSFCIGALSGVGVFVW